MSVFNKKTGRFTYCQSDPPDPYSLNTNKINYIYQDHVGAMWVGSITAVWIGTDDGGLNKMDRKADKFTYFVNDPKNPNSLSSNSIISIYAKLPNCQIAILPKC